MPLSYPQMDLLGKLADGWTVRQESVSPNLWVAEPGRALLGDAPRRVSVSCRTVRALLDRRLVVMDDASSGYLAITTEGRRAIA